MVVVAIGLIVRRPGGLVVGLYANDREDLMIHAGLDVVKRATQGAVIGESKRVVAHLSGPFRVVLGCAHPI